MVEVWGCVCVCFSVRCAGYLMNAAIKVAQRSRSMSKFKSYSGCRSVYRSCAGSRPYTRSGSWDKKRARPAYVSWSSVRAL